MELFLNSAIAQKHLARGLTIDKGREKMEEKGGKRR